MLNSHHRAHAQEIAQHEMGHYVVSRVLGFETGDVTLELLGNMLEHRGGAETTLTTPTAGLDEVQSFLERRVQVLNAGVLAQTLPANHPAKAVDNDRACDLAIAPAAKDDRSKARELIHLLRNIRKAGTDVSDRVACETELQAIDQELWNKSAELVEQNGQVIVELAKALAQRVTRIRQEFRMTAAELEALPAVQALRQAHSRRLVE